MSNQPNSDSQSGTSEAFSSIVGKPNLMWKSPQKYKDPDPDGYNTDDTVCCSKDCLSKISKKRRDRIKSEYLEEQGSSRAHLRSRYRPTRTGTYQYSVPYSDDDCLNKISEKKRPRLLSEYHQEQKKRSSDRGYRPTRTGTYQYSIPDSDDDSSGSGKHTLVPVCQEAYRKVFGISERKFHDFRRDESCKYSQLFFIIPH